MLRSILPFILLVLAPIAAFAQQATGAGHEVLSPAEFKARMSNVPGTLVDVRTPEEWNEGVIAGARLIDFHGAEFSSTIKQVDAARPVYLYCAAGGRSYKAAQLLENAGYSNVVELDGGMGAWKEAGYATVPPGSTSKR